MPLLSNSGSLKSLTTTTSCAWMFPASVITFEVSLIVIVTTFGRRARLVSLRLLSQSQAIHLLLTIQIVSAVQVVTEIHFWVKQDWIPNSYIGVPQPLYSNIHVLT